MVKNRKCLACGTSYSYCPSCSRIDRMAPAWNAQFCSEDCMTLWTTLTKYNMSRLTKSEAKEIISSLDLKPINTYAACVQRDYAKIMTRPKRLNIKKAENIPVPVEPEQPIEVVELVAIEPAHEVVIKENE